MRIQFIEAWFQPQSLQTLARCEAVIEQYQAQGLKMTLRQLYYQLVVQNAIPNKESAYKSLGRLVSRGRLAGYLDWEAIEDRIRVPKMPSQWDGPREIVQAAIDTYRLNRWEGQEHHVELWVEKDALAGVLQPIADSRHVTLMVNRGYSSQSAMFEASERFVNLPSDRWATILYLGDLDPSGEDMVRDIRDRLNETFGAMVDVVKLAITPEQVEEFQPPPNPAKMTDSRAARFVAEHGFESYEVDALPPDALRRIINAAIDEYVDRDKFDAVLAQEAKDKQELERLAGELRT